MEKMCPEDVLLGMTTSQWLTVIQIIIVAVGAIIALRALRANGRTARADVQFKLLKEGRDLRIKYGEANRLPDGPSKLVALDEYRGIIIAYYAGCFELADQIGLSSEKIRLLKADLCGTLRDDQIRCKWREVVDNYSRDFQDIVSSCGV